MFFIHKAQMFVCKVCSTKCTMGGDDSRMKKKWRVVFSLVALEGLVCLLLMALEPTYVFDWDAYMEEVAGCKFRQSLCHV